MKILLVSDEEEASFWDYYRPGKLSAYDLILSAGDLKPEYLSFLVTMANKPLLYVHGNHDGRYEKIPPEGCDCVDDRLMTVNGVRILGLGGSMCYSGGAQQYTEKQMARRIRKLRACIRRAGGVDIVLTHAPIAGLGDGEDLCHRGFEVFRSFLEEFQPKFWVHGHMHLRYSNRNLRMQQCGDTIVVNACGHAVIELPVVKEPQKRDSFFSIFRKKTAL